MRGRKPKGKGAGSARLQFAKGTVALTVSVCKIHAAVRSFYSVTEMKHIGSIAGVRRIPTVTVTTKTCQSNQGKSDGTGGKGVRKKGVRGRKPKGKGGL